MLRPFIPVLVLSFSFAATAAVPFASTELLPRSGSKAHGKVTLTKTPGGILVGIDMNEVPTGAHAIHIHENGNCSAEDGSSAGEHFNPGKHAHGGPTSAERHPGDFGNFTADKNKQASVEIRIADPTPGYDWQQVVGRSIIVHAGKDDLKSQPSGNSGDRIACGVIRKYENVAE